MKSWYKNTGDHPKETLGDMVGPCCNAWVAYGPVLLAWNGGLSLLLWDWRTMARACEKW